MFRFFTNFEFKNIFVKGGICSKYIFSFNEKIQMVLFFIFYFIYIRKFLNYFIYIQINLLKQLVDSIIL